MATVPRTFATGNPTPTAKPTNNEQLRHDRMVAVWVLIGFAGLIALAVWLGSLAGGTGGADYPYWMMP